MIRRAATLLAFSLALAGAGRADAATYTLAQLIAKVKAEYPGVIAAREALSSSEAQLSQAQRLWMPQGGVDFWITGAPNVRCFNNVTGDFNGTKADREASGCLRTSAVNLQNVPSGDIGDIAPIHGVALSISLNLLQPLYTFGKIEAANGAAHAGVKAAKGQVEAAEADVVFNAQRAYWGLKWSRAAVDVLGDGVSKLEDWIKRIDSAMNGKNPQKYTEGDLARLKIALYNAQLGLIDVRRAVVIAQSALRVLTADPEADIDDSELDNVEDGEHPVSFYEDQARLHRPEAKMLDAAATAAHYMHKLTLAQMLPDIGLATNFNYSYASSIDDAPSAFMSHMNGLGASFALVMHAPLDIGLRLGRLAQARADDRAMEARRRQALGGIAIEIDTAYANHQEADAREDETAHGEKVARGWYNAVDQDMQAGLYTEGRELTEAARAYFDFRLRHLQAIMDSNVTLAWLERTTGVE
ncbi:MAG TPA: TolC family protein [Polyangia bacterium]